MRPLLVALLLALSLPAVAQVYSYTDANGTTVYTNEPPQDSNAQTVDLPPTNSVSVPAPSSMAQPAQGSGIPASDPPPSSTTAPTPPPQVTTNPNDDSADDTEDGYDNVDDANTPHRDEQGLRRR